eukprot:TRINITY_DN457_c0_g1_i2.p1 TRINITY_DN457_c0_g1~~TRINITY_DN457_c0_g1_i2.p1  ORF type:complete len:505 (+),score=89.29 TRINITY_DN457_c0_g1_i2:456-1970(+)
MDASAVCHLLGDRYCVFDTVVGEGASCQVRLGFDKNNGNALAVKCVPKIPLVAPGTSPSPRVPDDSNDNTIVRDAEVKQTDEASVQRRIRRRQATVLREVSILNYLQSQPDFETSNCIRLLDSLEDEDTYYLVFEYYPTTLHAYVKRNRNQMPAATAQRICSQLAHAVRFLHSHGIAHRDLKIENVLIDETTLDVKLIDFGFATHFRPHERIANEWCGSPFTVAPEILSHQPYLPAQVDVWALGSVFYTVLCGVFPFQASTTAEIYQRTRLGKFHSFPMRVERVARDLISRCLMVDSSRRVSASQVMEHPFFWNDDDSDDMSESDDDDDDVDDEVAVRGQRAAQFDSETDGDDDSDNDEAADCAGDDSQDESEHLRAKPSARPRETLRVPPSTPTALLSAATTARTSSSTACCMIINSSHNHNHSNFSQNASCPHEDKSAGRLPSLLPPPPHPAAAGIAAGTPTTTQSIAAMTLTLTPMSWLTRSSSYHISQHTASSDLYSSLH